MDDFIISFSIVDYTRVESSSPVAVSVPFIPELRSNVARGNETTPDFRNCSCCALDKKEAVTVSLPFFSYNI